MGITEGFGANRLSRCCVYPEYNQRVRDKSTIDDAPGTVKTKVSLHTLHNGNLICYGLELIPFSRGTNQTKRSILGDTMGEKHPFAMFLLVFC